MCGKRILLWILAVIVINSVGAEDENPSMENCGISKVSSESKIVGGRFARPGEFPWQLSLEMRMVPIITNYQHICGASLINENFAVTAAHCIPGGYFTTYRVYAGTCEISTKSVATKHLVIPYVHEGYLPSSLNNDIALLRLTTPIDIKGSGGMINGVCLPDRSMKDNVTGMGTVTGWGTTSQGGQLSDKLRAVDVPIITDEECGKAYKDMIEDSMLCAGYEEGGKDSCQGDSGGPFVQRNSEGVSTLIGIVSWGKGCAQANNPGVYTETAYFMDWIVQTMKTLSWQTPGSVPGTPQPSGGSEGESGAGSEGGSSAGSEGGSGADSQGESGAGSQGESGASSEEQSGPPEGAGEYPNNQYHEQPIVTTPALPDGVIIKN